MPRTVNTQIVGADASRVSRPNEAVLQPAAQPVNTYVAPAADNEFAQLAAGLASIHAPLARMQQKQDDEAHRNAILQAKAAGELAPDPASADGAEIAVGNVPPAFRSEAMGAYSEAIGKRLGMNAQGDYLDAYARESQKPDFNFDAFSQQFRAQHLNGLADPHLAIGAATHIDEAIALARGDYRKKQMADLHQKNVEALGTDLSMLNPFAAPDVNAQHIFAAAEGYKQRGGVKAEAVQHSFEQMQALSTQHGGTPDLFDAFTQVDPMTGLSLVQMNPGLADNVAKAQKLAEDQRNKTLWDQSLTERSLSRADLEKGLIDGRFDRMGDGDLQKTLTPYIGKYGLFNSDGEYAQFVHKVYERQAQIALREHDRAVVTSGAAGSLPADRQKGLLAEALRDVEPIITAGFNDASKANEVSAALRTIVTRTKTGGFTEASPVVKGLIGSLENDLPATNATTPPKFVAAARFYQDLKASGNPKVVAEYFPEKLQHVMESYLHDVGQDSMGSDTAYRRAYESSSPEARARADQMMKAPGVAEKVQEIADKSVSFLRRNIPGGKAMGLAPDTSLLDQRLRDEMKRYMASTPTASFDDAVAYGKRWRDGNSFHDTTTNTLIEIPQAMNSPVSQEALSEWLGMVKGAWSKGDNTVTPRLAHKGNGIYTLTLQSSNGGVQTQGDVDLHDILAVHQAKKNITGAEFERLGVIRQRLLAGTFTAQEAGDNASLIQKATDVGALKGDEAAKAFRLRVQARAQDVSPVLNEALQKAPRVSAAAHLRDLDGDTVPVAQQFLARGDFTGALTAMGERVRLVAYKDPARGMNIGLGYNMTVNAKSIVDDFRRAGIPPEYTEAIKQGKMAITPEQATRLFDAVRPRYEAMAKAGLEKHYPGQWDKLPPNAQAVITDLAYQTGNVSKFENGLGRLIQGDFSGSGLQASFIQRNTNERRVDERRHALRVAMLRGAIPFQTLLSDAAKQPAGPLEARLARAGGAPS